MFSIRSGFPHGWFSSLPPPPRVRGFAGSNDKDDNGRASAFIGKVINGLEYASEGAKFPLKTPLPRSDPETAPNSSEPDSSLYHLKQQTFPRPKKVKPKAKAPKEKPLKVILHENDLKESTALGGGPGGQSVNKSQNSVTLIHLPTAFSVVGCQPFRALADNRKAARKILTEKLDVFYNGDLSKKMVKVGKLKKLKAKKRGRAREKYGVAGAECTGKKDDQEGDFDGDL